MISFLACVILASVAADAPSASGTPFGQAVPAQVPSRAPSDQAEQLAKFQHLRRAKRQNYHEKCECKYSPGGCRIQTAPPKGYKCKCEYIFLWTCWGFGQDCVKGEQCPPAYCKSHWCCQLGGGDCKGLVEPVRSN